MSGTTDKPGDPAGNSVVARADALMQRRRTQTGSQTPGLELPVLTEAVAESSEDLPVLTEIEAPAPPVQAAPPLPTALLDPAQLDELAKELTRRVHDRLTAELPCLVEASLQSILYQLTQELEQGLTETTEAAIRDFLQARQRAKQR